MFGKTWLKMFRLISSKSASLSIRLVKWTGKSKEYIHPKHLLKENLEHYWYLEYIKPEDIVLDVGCGNGMHAIKIAQKCKKIVGLDYDEGKLRIAGRMTLERNINNVEFRLCNIEETFPIVNAQFDKILFLDCLEHLNNRDFVLQEIRKVLKNDGLLFLSAPNKETSWKRKLKRAGLPYYSDPDHKIEYTKNELTAELARNGFEIKQDIMPIVYDTPLAGFIDLVGGISLKVYERLSQWKRKLAKNFPRESTGFRVICKKREEDL